jgi:hypothetical protein
VKKVFDLVVGQADFVSHLSSFPVSGLRRQAHLLPTCVYYRPAK